MKSMSLSFPILLIASAFLINHVAAREAQLLREGYKIVKKSRCNKPFEDIRKNISLKYSTKHIVKCMKKSGFSTTHFVFYVYKPPGDLEMKTVMIYFVKKGIFGKYTLVKQTPDFSDESFSNSLSDSF